VRAAPFRAPAWTPDWWLGREITVALHDYVVVGFDEGHLLLESEDSRPGRLPVHEANLRLFRGQIQLSASEDL
jgi:hypothetical protein